MLSSRSWRKHLRGPLGSSLLRWLYLHWATYIPNLWQKLANGSWGMCRDRNTRRLSQSGRTFYLPHYSGYRGRYSSNGASPAIRQTVLLKKSDQGVEIEKGMHPPWSDHALMPCSKGRTSRRHLLREMLNLLSHGKKRVASCSAHSCFLSWPWMVAYISLRLKWCFYDDTTWPTLPDIQIFSDACGSWGCAAIIMGQPVVPSCLGQCPGVFLGSDCSQRTPANPGSYCDVGQGVVGKNCWISLWQSGCCFRLPVWCLKGAQHGTHVVLSLLLWSQA